MTTLATATRLATVAAVLALPHGTHAAKKPVAAKKPSMLRTYRFTAKIIENGGVTPLKVGTKLTGEFTYDLAARNESSHKGSGLYQSPKNTIEFCYGKLAFPSRGSGWVEVRFKGTTESVSIVGPKLKLPEGWRGERGPFGGTDTSFLIVFFQYRRRAGMLGNCNLPNRLDLGKRLNWATVGILFPDGVRFPGQRAKRRGPVYAKFESLDRIRSKKP